MEEKNIKMFGDSNEPRYFFSGYMYEEVGSIDIVIGSVEIFGYTKDDIQQTSLYMDYKTSSDSDWERMDLYNPPDRGGVNDTYRMTGELYKNKYINVLVKQNYLSKNFYEQKFIFGIDTSDEQHWEFDILHFKPYVCSFDGDSADTVSPYMHGKISFPETTTRQDGIASVEEYLDDDEKVTISNSFLTYGTLPEKVSVRCGVSKFKLVMGEHHQFISEPFTWSDRINPNEFIYTNIKDLDHRLTNDVYDYLCQKDMELDFSDSAFSDLDILHPGEDDRIIQGYIIAIGSSIYCRDGIDDQYFSFGLNTSTINYTLYGEQDGEQDGIHDFFHISGFRYIVKSLSM